MQADALGDPSTPIRSPPIDARPAPVPGYKADLIVFVLAAVTLAVSRVVFVFFFSLASTR